MIQSIAKNFDSNQPKFFIVSCTFSRFYAGMRRGKRADAAISSLSPMANRTMRRTLARRPRQDDRTKVTRLAVVLSLFLALLAAALLVGGRAVIDPMLRAAAEARETNRVGDIVFTMPDGAFCRHLSFDNRTAEIIESTSERCPEARPGGRGSPQLTKGFAWGVR